MLAEVAALTLPPLPYARLAEPTAAATSPGPVSPQQQQQLRAPVALYGAIDSAVQGPAVSSPVRGALNGDVRTPLLSLPM